MHIGHDYTFLIPDICDQFSFGTGDIASPCTDLSALIHTTATGGGDDHGVSSGEVFHLLMAPASPVVHPENNGASQVGV